MAVLMKRQLVTAVACALAASAVAVIAQGPTASTHAGLAGVWVISPDAQLRGPDNQRAPGGPIGRRGRGGFGGYGGGGYSRGQGRDGGNPYAEERDAVTNLSRALMNPFRQMTIVVNDPAIEIVLDDGRRMPFETTNKKVDGRAENGFVRLTRRARWEGDALVTEIDIENGATFQQRYELIADGAQLRVVTTAEGYGRDDDGKRIVTHVYERPAPDQSAYQPPGGR